MVVWRVCKYIFGNKRCACRHPGDIRLRIKEKLWHVVEYVTRMKIVPSNSLKIQEMYETMRSIWVMLRKYLNNAAMNKLHQITQFI